MNRSSDHGYTEDDVRLVEAAIDGAGTALEDLPWHIADTLAVAALNALANAGRLLPADTRTEYGVRVDVAHPKRREKVGDVVTHLGEEKSLRAPEVWHGWTTVQRRSWVGPWLPVSHNPEITDTPAGAVSGNSDPDVSPDTKEEPDAAPTAAVDLMAALKASMERARAARSELTGARSDTKEDTGGTP